MADDLFNIFEQEEQSTTNQQYLGERNINKLATKRRIDEEEDDGNEIENPSKKSNKNDDDLNEMDNDEWKNSDKLPRITIHKLHSLDSCTHEVAIPNDIEYKPLKINTQLKPAKEYKFTLDPFQKEAILCLENQQSVLVSAHTSAGKTVCAEYVIAMSLRDQQRVIYTTPIKALSNQKYRELREEFEDVGLMTGDVTINPTASCLIMTTEILRSMLYRGSEITREVAWVIFDEIHYMRDKERGVIWEETIILLNDNVHYVFLSATIPNARQFAEWVAYLHKQPCHVVYTDYRPTPLQHYIYPANGDGIHLVVDEAGVFKEDNFNKAMQTLKDSSYEQQQKSNGVDKRNPKSNSVNTVGGGTSGDSNCFKIVKLIMERQMAPVIVFSFSKKECEAYALLASKLDLNTDEEKQLVERVFNNAIHILSDEDKKLPQVEMVLPLLKKGIGIHHSGLLPILKETIEILFGEGLLKALFATETFSMGLNMPARTVLFTACRKFDGKEIRWITSGEYIQMSGRAGRRGLDDKGIVILMIDERMSPSAAKDIVKGNANPLNSAFHLTYNMVLNLLRVEGINPEFMLERSFFQFQNYANIPTLVEKVKQYEEEYKSLDIKRENEISTYFHLRQQIETFREQLTQFITTPKYILPFLNPGRLVKVVNKEDDFGWGVVVNFRKKTNQKPNSEPIYIIDTLLYVTKESSKKGYLSLIKPCNDNDGVMHIVPIQPDLIKVISEIRVFLPNNIQSPDSRQSVWKSIREVKKRCKDTLPLLDPVEDMGIKDAAFIELIRKIESIEDQISKHPLHTDPDMPQLYKLFESKTTLRNKLKSAKSELKQAWSLLQMDDLKCRKRVLRRLGYCNEQDVIETKGRVACEIDTGDELVLTEMLLNGIFNDLSVAQCVALLSCFVINENVKEDMPKLTQELSQPYKILQDTAKRVATVSKECKLDVEVDEYVDNFKPYLMDVMNEWVNGASFLQICSMTTIFEGNLIRYIRRLEELLRQMSCAAKAIGNSPLEEKFNEGIIKIKRNIVFAASLYL